MTYGIEIKNNLGSILIDQAYPNFGPTSTSVSTVSPGTSYPPAGTNQFLDLIFAAPSVGDDALVSIEYDGVQRNWQDNNSLGVPTNYRYYVFRDFADISGAGTGYGLQVFGADGSIYFDSEQDFYFRVLAIGSDCVELSDMILPSPTTNYTNLQNIFCMVNSSAVAPDPAGNPGGYVYNWASSTTGQITIKTGFKGVFPFNDGPSYIVIEVLGI
jgi:hypothetical protein